MKVTFTKIQKTGAWGLRLQLDPGEPKPAPGAQVTAQRQDGSTEACVVGSCYWEGPDRTNPACHVMVVGFSSVRGSLPRAGARRSRDYPGKDCPACDSEPLDARLHCWECGYTGRA